MRRARCLLALLVWALASCDHSTAPPVLDGLWVHVPSQDQPPGLSLGVVFSTTNGEVTGSGGWQGEAMPPGTVTATGQIDRSTVTLDFTFIQLASDGTTQVGSFAEHFVGSFTSRDDLVGTTTVNGVQGVLHLRHDTAP